MPAYINIQCFKKCNKDEFDYFLEKFKFVLRNLNFDESYFASYIDRITWKLSDNGFMYSGCNMPSQQIKFYNEYLSVRPLIMGLGSEKHEGLTDAWVEFAILLTEDEVFKDYVTCEMHNSAKRAIWFIGEQLSSYFPKSMVYVTDEATDARPWEALLGLNGDKYSFYLAIAPKLYHEEYSCIPHNFIKLNRDNKMFIAIDSVWCSEDFNA